MSEDRCIYGVDLSREITPILVRDAIIECFTQAQHKLINFMIENIGSTQEDAKKINVDQIIKNAFKDVNGDYDNPTKESLINLIMKLKDYAKNAFRETEIIEKHASEIQQLIDKLK